MSVKISNARRSFSMKTGRDAEIRFKRAAEALGLEVTKSTRQEDKELHVDYWMALDGKGHWGVDVKGNNRPDEIWCEFKNVGGNLGWMYGEATVIAFDMPEAGGFCIVNRGELATYCEENVSDEAVTHKRNDYKNKYTRKDRKDVITILHLSDIQTLDSYRVWEYFNDYS